MSSFVGTFDPSSLFAGPDDILHRDVTYASGSAIVMRGTLLARVATGGAASVAAGQNDTSGTPVANTGNAVLTPDGSAPVTNDAEAGTYKVVFQSATGYNVYDPAGDEIGSGVIATAFSGSGIKFNIAAGGTAMVAGDTIDYNVTLEDAYAPAVATATNGLQIPSAVAAWDVDVTAGAVVGPAYFAGTFAGEKMYLDPSWTIPGAQAVLRQNNSQIYIKSLGSLG